VEKYFNSLVEVESIYIYISELFRIYVGRLYFCTSACTCKCLVFCLGLKTLERKDRVFTATGSISKTVMYLQAEMMCGIGTESSLHSALDIIQQVTYYKKSLKIPKGGNQNPSIEEEQTTQ
jgi:hypothetical protein